MSTSPQQHAAFANYLRGQELFLTNSITQSLREHITFYADLDLEEFSNSVRGLLQHTFEALEIADSSVFVGAFSATLEQRILAGYPIDEALQVPLLYRQVLLDVAVDALHHGIPDAREGIRATLRLLDEVERHVTSRFRIELQRLNAIINNSLDGVLLYDREGVITFANQALAHLIGQNSAADIVGKVVNDLVPPEEQLRIQQEVNPALAEVGNWLGQIWAFHEGGGRWLAHASVFRLARISGESSRHGAILRDITESARSAQDRLKLLLDLEAQTDALRKSQEEREALQAEVITTQEAAIRELSTPLIPLADGVVAMPLVGTINTSRAQQIMETLLEGIGTHQAHVALIDITGVRVVDTQVADALLRAARAARLLGAQVVLTGIGPEIAQTLVSLGADMTGLITRGSLRDGIAFGMQAKGT
jgi:PAS domain S-box-containing protein